MDLELAGKKALISGGSRGIGKQVARQLASEGVDVAIGARDRARLDVAVGEIQSESGRRIVGFTGDTRDDALVEKMVKDAAEALGGIDILVNAAATPRLGAPSPRYDEITAEFLLDDINTKVMGYLRCARAVAPYMIESGWGRIVNISGMAIHHTGNIVGAARNISVVALTKNLADELGKHGINVNLVHPGATVTEQTLPEGSQSRLRNNVIGRMVDASEVAAVIVFLCSPKSVAVTGDSIMTGGGDPGVIYY